MVYLSKSRKFICILYRITKSRFEPIMLNASILAERNNKLTTTVYRKDFKFKTESIIDMAASSLHVLDDNAATFQITMFFERFKSMSKMFIRNVNHLISTGVIEKLEKKRNSADGPVLQPDVHVARPLTMDHLGICFIFILSFLGLAIFAFAVECIVGYCRR